MNSITPILSLSESVSGLLVNKEGKTKLITDINNEDLDDIQVALKTINNRSKSLLKFVKDYRKMSKIPVPELNPVNLNELISRIIKLFEPQIIKNQIDFKTHIPNPKLTINTDAGLLEQVIINLLINSVDAMSNSKHKILTISAYQNNLNTIIEVKDTGCGIKKEVLDRIFVPFYSTKNHGSGIGLSLSKQIINVLDGTIKIDSKPDAGTTFYLVF
jgi:signal transduction histidine kinase